MSIRLAKGFTLVEIIIVVAIIGILAAIAYPNYIESVRKSNRADAKAALNQVAQQMQRCYTLSATFADCPVLGETPSGEEYYNVNVTLADGGTGFRAVATPAKKPQLGDEDCLQFTLDHIGRRSASPDSEGSCW